MKVTLIVSALSLCLLMGGFNYLIHKHNDILELPMDALVVDSTGLHPASYTQKSFYEGIEQLDYIDMIPEAISGGIVSHHLLAREDIAKFFAEFRSQTVDTVVLVSPNHYTIGDAGVITSKTGFTTPYGNIEINKDVVESLVSSKIAFEDNELFKHEHSVGALTPYIAYNFPEADIVPLVVRQDVKRKQLDDLLESVESVLPENTIVIASVDFSHHLNRVATEFHDVTSVSAIMDFDYDRVFQTEIDSPASIYFLLQYLENRDAMQMDYINKNSTDYTGNFATEDATSYVFAHFTSGKKNNLATAATSLHFGDMMFDREIKNILEDGGDIFEEIKGRQGNFLSGVDVTVGNLEGVISTSTECREDKEVLLQFETSIANLLSKYNFSGVNLANNHTGDCFESGIKQTQDTLQNNGLFFLGSEKGDGYEIVDVGSESIALVGVNEVTRWQNDIKETLSLIEKLSDEHDSVVVHVHWGLEFDNSPSEEQRSLAHQLVDAGAEVIIGHHPHVVQDVEMYNGKIIFYSLGNFIFDQVLPGTTNGFAVGLVHEEGVTGGVIFPYKINDYKPRLLQYGDMSEYCTQILTGVDRVAECGFVIK